MAISKVGSVTQTAFATGSDSWRPVNFPSGVQANDLLLCYFVTNAGNFLSGSPNILSGWTQIGSRQLNATDTSGHLIYRIATSAETSWNFYNLWQGAPTGMAVVMALRNVNLANPVPQSAQKDYGTVTTATANEITTTFANSLVIQFVGSDPGAGAWAASPAGSPNGNEDFDAKESSGGNLAYCAIQSYLKPTTGPITLAMTVTSDGYQGFVIAVAPAFAADAAPIEAADKVSASATVAVTATAASLEAPDGLVSAVETSVKLYLRNTQANGIGSTYYDLVTAAGAAADTAIVNATVSGTEIQWTKTAGGAVAQWVSGRVPASGFTLKSVDVSIWGSESTSLENAGGRIRVFKRAADTTETEIGGGPFDSGIEFTTSDAEYAWTGDVNDTAFAEDDRVLLKIYITNIGVMAVGTCTLTFNAADASTGDSFLSILPQIAFKDEEVVVSHTPGKIGRLTQFGVGSKDYVGFIAKSPAQGDITGTAQLVEQADALSSAATVALSASASLAEAADTLTAAATALVTASAAVQEVSDTLSGATTVLVTASAALQESVDVLSASAGSSITASATPIEADDTLLAQSAVAIAVSAALTEYGDTLSASGTLEALVGPHTPSNIARLAQFAVGTKKYKTFSAKAPAGPSAITGSGTPFEESDRLASAVAVAISAAFSAVESADTLTAAASSALAVTATLLEQSDVVSASGAVSVSVTAAIIERSDSLTAATTVAIAATAALLEASDALSASATALSAGQHTPGRIGRLAQFGIGTKDYVGFVGKANDSQAERFANASPTEVSDALSSDGTVQTPSSAHDPGHITRLGQFGVGLTIQSTFAPKTGSRTADAALLEIGDSLAAAASVSITASLSVAEAADAMSAAVAVAVAAALAAREQDDRLASDGGSAVFAGLSVTERADTLASAAAAAVSVTAMLQEESDRLLSSVSAALSATATPREADDSLSATASSSISANASMFEAGDRLDASGGASTFAIAALLESADRVTASGAVLVTGNTDLLEAADRLSASGFGTVTGAAAILEAADIVVASGAVAIAGIAALREADDRVAANAIAASIIIDASLREASDSINATAVHGYPIRIIGRDRRRSGPTASDAKKGRVTAGDARKNRMTTDEEP